MESRKSKTLILNTLLLVFCVVIIALFCFGPTTKENKVLESYNIIFDSDGGSAIAALKIEKGTKIEQPEAPTREGYIFVGWMLGDEFYDFASDVTGDVTLKAKWEVKQPDLKYYTISFSTGGGTTVTPITVQEGTTGYAPMSPTRDGFTFVEWQLNGLTYDFTQIVNEDITLVAIWEVAVDEPEEPEEPAEVVTKYKVKFNLNGGTGGNAKTQNVEEGKKASKPSKNPTKSGYTFVGWYLDGKAYDFSTVVTKDITLTAQWQEVKAKIYYVDFYAYDGTMCYASVEEGKTASVPANCKAANRAGYKFVGWNTNSKATTANFVPGSTKVTSNMKVYQIYKAHVYTVGCTYNTDGTGNATTCTLYIMEDGKKLDNVDNIYINGKVSRTISIKGMWEKINSVSFDYGELKGHTATK